MRWSSPAGWALILASFLAVAILQAWPLPRHFSTHLTGDPAGDTGVYVWNLWVFRHQLVDRQTSPFETTAILPLDGPTDLSLHNYTVAADLAALPLQPFTGVVAAFNLIYLLNVALAGVGMCLLARRLHQTAGIGFVECWLAGLAFACSPYLVSRSEGHFSLVAAAALPFFVLAFDRAWTGRRIRDAAAAGACVAWAGFSDPYYAIYCLLLAVVVIALHNLRITRASPSGSRVVRVIIDVAIGLVAAITVVIGTTGVQSVVVGSAAISTSTLYTPVLVLTLLACVRLWLTLRPRVHWAPTHSPMSALVTLGVVGAVAALVLAPQLIRIAGRITSGRMVHASVLWRSGAPGLDVLSYFVPNPSHPLAPDSFARLFIIEFQASMSFVAMGVIAAAAWRRQVTRMTGQWIWVTLVFALLALGPFVHVGGVNTHVPGPWAFLRYLPVLGDARMPSRLAVIVSMALAAAFAGALSSLVKAQPGRRRVLLYGVGLALALELLPAPRPLYRADIPEVYRRVATDPAPGVVLDLPFGIKDGLGSLGLFEPRSQFHQTFHGKPLLGGYLSRVDEGTKARYLASPFIRALITLSDPGRIGTPIASDLMEAGAAFRRDTNVRYVVMHTPLTHPALRAFAIETLALEHILTSGDYELYMAAR
jgi:hypothetical protein